MAEFVFVGDAARELGANPKDISDLFYLRKLRADLCPVTNGRRMIPRTYLRSIAAVLRRAGKQVGEVEG